MSANTQQHDENPADGRSDSNGELAIIDGMVLPKVVYYPHIIVTTWFKTWGIKCGRCEKDFHRFALFGKPACPYCGTKNAPQFYAVC